jgi:uncharacterized protein (DUF885 family)
MFKPNKKLMLSVSLMAFTAMAGLAPVAFSADTGKTAAVSSLPKIQTESERLNAFFEASFQKQLKRSPMEQTFLGIKDDYDKWDDISDKKADEDLAIVKQELATLHKDFDFNKLDEQSKLSYRLFERNARETIEGDHWRHDDYPVNQMFGYQSEIPAILMNMHRIDSEDDAKAYIARLKGIKFFMSQLTDQLKIRARQGVIAPKFVYPFVRSDIDNLLKGKPFDASPKDSPLLEDFRGKVEKLSIDNDRKKALIAAAEGALKDDVKPGYQMLLQELGDLEKVATTDAGVWKFPHGDAYYAFALKNHTTTDLTPDQIHTLGLSEVARIHKEMEALIKKVGFKGDLQAFFQFIKSDKRFHEPNTPEGRADYMKRAHTLLDAMKAKLPTEFATLPKADVEVKAVEPFREKTAVSAFYEQPAPDGSRPGRVYFNLYDMSRLPIYEMEALIYHEGIPGHHMQIAIAQELKGLPKFRKYGDYTAYVEGWGLYSERLGKDMGFYQDPYSDFGRLTMELWRAVRLVVDSGMHSKHWTREQAIDYFEKNTPIAHNELVKEVERYIVMPGQATAYKVGMMKIMSLRKMAQSQLGAKFDIREFHDVVLKNGAVPLEILEENVKSWIADKKKAA